MQLMPALSLISLSCAKHAMQSVEHFMIIPFPHHTVFILFQCLSLLALTGPPAARQSNHWCLFSFCTPHIISSSRSFSASWLCICLSLRSTKILTPSPYVACRRALRATRAAKRNNQWSPVPCQHDSSSRRPAHQSIAAQIKSCSTISLTHGVGDYSSRPFPPSTNADRLKPVVEWSNSALWWWN